jgi:hypothetical protein
MGLNLKSRIIQIIIYLILDCGRLYGRHGGQSRDPNNGMKNFENTRGVNDFLLALQGFPVLAG